MVRSRPKWLTVSEDRAWRTFTHAHDQLDSRLRRHLLQDSGLSDADYKILAVLSEHPAGYLSAQELCGVLQWEKSRLSHQVRRMQQQRLITREPNPADARSVIIRLRAEGRRAIEKAAPLHVEHVRQHFVDLFSPDELDTLTALSERLLGHLAEVSLPDPEHEVTSRRRTSGGRAGAGPH